MASKSLVITERITKRETVSLEKYFQDINKFPKLTVDEEYEIALKAQTGDEAAIEQLINCNLRFVVSVAKQYETKDVLLIDLINEGNYGLAKAANQFDPSKGFKFISYAVHWIRRYVREYLTQHSRTIRIPSNQATNISRLTRLRSDLEQRFERKITTDEMIDYVGTEFSKAEIVFFMEQLEFSSTSSLDKPFSGDDNNGDIKDTISSDTLPEADYITKSDDMLFIIESLLDLLPKENQKEILKMYYGLNGTGQLDMKEISEVMGISRERVRQIKDTALGILKAKALNKNMQHIYEGQI